MLSFSYITGREWISLPPAEREHYVEDAAQYWRAQGFPHYSLGDEDMRGEFSRLIALNPRRIYLPQDELQSSNVGIALANHFHPRMWSVQFARHRTPVQCFEDDKLLRDCIRHALTIWPDRKGASPAVLRDILRTFRHTRRVSNFRPTVAKALYERYSKPGDRVLDFSAGYGGRLLGCMASSRDYVGYDPCEDQIRGLECMTETLNMLGLQTTSVDLHQVCAEDGLQEEQDGSFSLIFTSPPYFDLEKYSNETTQSYLRYPTYVLWRERFLRQVICESYRILKRDGYLILNVSDINGATIATDTLKIACELFELHVEYRLRLGILPYNRNGSSKPFRFEPVFVFRKRD